MNPDQVRHSNNIIILKGRFKSNSMNLYGQFILFFNQDCKIDSYNIVISTYSDAYSLEPHTGWESYEEFITDLKWKGHFYNSMTASLMDQFTKLAEDSRSTEELFNLTYNYDYDNLEVIIHDTINRIVHEKNLILETGIQEVTPEEIRNARSDRDSAPQEQNEINSPEDDDNLDKGSVILPIKPILAPVNGKPLYSLKIGDRIMIRIIPNSDRANYFIDILGLRTEDKIKPTVAEVIDIKAGLTRNDPVEIMTQIGPGVFGKFYEDENQVKLRMYDPEIDGELSKGRIPDKKNKNKKAVKKEIEAEYSTGTMVMLFLFGLILILIIILIILSL